MDAIHFTAGIDFGWKELLDFRNDGRKTE